MSEKSNKSESTLEVGTVSNCMYKLWESSADNLTSEQLKWFAGLSDGIEAQIRCLAEVTEGIGCMVADDTTGSFSDGRSLSTLMFNINHQLETITGLVQISRSAYDRLAYPEIYERLKKIRAEPDKA